MREGNPKATARVIQEAEDDRDERMDEQDWDGHYHLSVFAAPLLDDETLDQAVARLFGTHRKVKNYRASTAERLASAGFPLLASPPEPFHYDADLGTDLSAPVVEKFEQCFDAPRRNPAWTKG